MSSPELNPYSSPISQAVQESDLASESIRLASQSQRFVNFLLDRVVLSIVSYGIGAFVGLAIVLFHQGQPILITEWKFTLIGFTAGIFLVRFVLETTTGATLGKIASGTKVVSQDGSRATVGQIAGRCLCRWIPFEPFSFFGGDGFPFGWHDRISGTRVVKSR